METSEELKDALRRIFDAQIPNFGDYNLVCASNEHAAAKAGHHRAHPKFFIVGYRRQPAELVVAPFNAPSLTAGSVPVTLNMTNLSHAMELADGDYEVGTSTGRSFRFGVGARAKLPSAEGPDRVVDQRDDQEDFADFMTDLVRLTAPSQR